MPNSDNDKLHYNNIHINGHRYTKLEQKHCHYNRCNSLHRCTSIPSRKLHNRNGRNTNGPKHKPDNSDSLSFNRNYHRLCKLYPTLAFLKITQNKEILIDCNQKPNRMNRHFFKTKSNKLFYLHVSITSTNNK